MDMEGRRGEEGEDEMYEESDMETYTTICKIDSQWEFPVWLWEFKQGLCKNLEGWYGVVDGRELQEGRDLFTYGWFMLIYGRNKIL